jgi:molecular chaperone GrpE (heat shock protein)
MARGWESKSVESQMEAAESKQAASGQAVRTEEQIRVDKERESLELYRKRVLHDIENATHYRYQKQLEAALAHLDKRLKELSGE